MNMSHGEWYDNVYLACTKVATCLFKTSGGYVHNFSHVHQDTFAQRGAFEPKLYLTFAVMIIVYRWSRTTPRTQCTSMPNDHHRENHRQNQDQTCRNIRSTSGRAPFGRPCQKGPVEMCCIISLIITMTLASAAEIESLDLLLQFYLAQAFEAVIATSSGAIKCYQAM